MFRIDQLITNAYGTKPHLDLVPGLTSQDAAIAEAAARHQDALRRTNAIDVTTCVYLTDGQRLQRLVHRETSPIETVMPTYRKRVHSGPVKLVEAPATESLDFNAVAQL